MKYLKHLFIFFLTLSFSVNIITSTLACKMLDDTTSSINTLAKDENLKQDNNNTFIDAPNNVVEVFNHNNNLIYLTEEDLNLMAKIVYAESKGEPYEGKVAVASVILNRVLDQSFPNTVKEVIFQPYAFSCVVNGEIPGDPNKECFNAVYDAIKGNDPTNEALFFYNPTISTCTWMENIQKNDSKTIGQHLFFKTN
ncbi:cell wall hydrolase [Clostridium septicum]|uniref:Cell wall hydrolase n=1 Tax=Clostridium septicum TaxID=1504 RepID=A0A9N7JMK4_CLOSE|nr:cell wall hydrolase [Clostridium septicum]AYE34596.1 cell wall hydrolase [Clostridium septicum]MDU1314062.1 cell wall hydrolase [Clostridium septicum]QAS59996.1 cell wall hydrolase [Clostridium septicum]UEC20763.1 cell wall hydrolase [Clostridium septicum]USS01187.1 cell wall hydrolase [Clostridium septicum]